MIFERDNDNNFFDNHHIDNDEQNDIKNFISNNSQSIINNNLHNFIKDKNYKNIKEDNTKNKIFFFASFINSCKTYNNISEIKKDIKKILKSEIDNNDYYYNIIYNYLNNILEIINQKNFFDNEKNCECLLKIFKKIYNYLNINVNEFSTIINKMVQVEREILIILIKNLIYKSISETNIILKEHINKMPLNLFIKFTLQP